MDTTYMTKTEINQYKAIFEPYHRCDFCSVNVPEESMERIDGYYLCQDCYETYSTEQDEN